MNLKKAIEILSEEAYGHSHTTGPDWYDAVKLGTEALKVRHGVKCQVSPKYYQPLPGETNGV